MIDPGLWTTNGQVTASLLSGQTLYVGGTFSYVGPNTGGFVATDSATGAPLAGWPRVNGTVYAAAADSAGGWFIGGSFKSISGVYRTNLAHLRADGSVDDWDPAADGTVYAIGVNGRTVYVGGSFGIVGGSVRPNIAALDASTGLATPWSPTANGTVRTLLVRGGTVYAGGNFSIVGGRSRNYIAELDASTGIATTWNPAANGEIDALEQSGEVIYAGGGFKNIGGLPRNFVAALDVGTGLAAPWNPNPNDTVFALALGPNTVYAGGKFGAIGGEGRGFLAALDATTGVAFPWNPGANGVVRDLSVNGTSVCAAGGFSILGGERRRSLAEIDAKTGIVTAWDPGASAIAYTVSKGVHSVLVGGAFTSAGGRARDNLAAIDVTTGAATPWNPGADGEVTALAMGGSTLYAGGLFSSIGGQLRDRLAALDAGTGLATSWDPHLGFGRILSLAANANRVFVSGPETSAYPNPPQYPFAAVDGLTGVNLGWAAAPNQEVLAMAATPTRLYVGGKFTSIGGQARNRIAALDANSGAVASWNPGAGWDVNNLLTSGRLVYAVGFFSSIGGQPRNYAAALDSATGAPTSWTPGAADPCYDIAVSGGRVYIPGRNITFPWAPPGGYNDMGIAVTDSATGLSRAWLPASNSWSSGTSRVLCLAASPSAAYAGGSFTHLAGVPSANLGRILFDAPLAPAVDVLAPDGGERAAIGDTLPIAWSATTDARGIQSVDLWVSRSGPGGPWELVAAGLSNSGSYAWRVPGPIASDDCWMRIDARNWDGTIGSDRSLASFTIEQEALGVPAAPPQADFTLRPISPNPASGRGVMRYEVRVRAQVRLGLFDVQGREVARLAEGLQEAGRHSVAFDAKTLEPGLYFARLQAPGADLRQRVVVLR